MKARFLKLGCYSGELVLTTNPKHEDKSELWRIFDEEVMDVLENVLGLSFGTEFFVSDWNDGYEILVRFGIHPAGTEEFDTMKHDVIKCLINEGFCSEDIIEDEAA